MSFFDIYSPEFDADPYPIYARLRDEHPCYWHGGVKKWFLTRYEDVSAAANDWEMFSSTNGNLVDEFAGRAGNTLGTMDPPRHDRVRALVQMAFSRKNLVAIEPYIRDQIRTIVGRQDGVPRFDFVSEISTQITVSALSQLLGIDHANPNELREKALLMVQTDPVKRTKTKVHLDAMDWMKALAIHYMEARRVDPGSDVITALIQAEIDGDGLTEDELILTISTIVMAGVESLSGYLTMLGLNLADHPEACRAASQDPSKIPALIEETLRFNTNAQRFKRVARRDVQMHGQTIKAGDEIVLCYAAANRDERKFDNPNVFDPERASRGHLGLGGGVHFCIGAVLGKMVSKIFLEEYLAMAPTLVRRDEELKWLPSTNFRAPLRLVMEQADLN